MGMLWPFLVCAKFQFYFSCLGYKAVSYSCYAFGPPIVKNCYLLHFHNCGK